MVELSLNNACNIMGPISYSITKTVDIYGFKFKSLQKSKTNNISFSSNYSTLDCNRFKCYFWN